MATPLAVSVALFITHYAPRRLAQTLGYLVDLLAAVPSIVYGLWGAAVLGPASVGFATWANEWLGWLPFFAGPVSATGRTMLVAGLVLAVMILPIITAVSREVFLQTPKLHEEAALALGATRWEMIRMAVLPFGRSGVISGAMLGLGRALGETMAVAIVLSVSGLVTFNLISSSNPSTIAANIALQFPESSGRGGERAHRLGPRALRDHAARQRARPLHRQPPPRVLGSQLMSTGTERGTEQRPDTDSAPRRRAPVRRTTGQELPGWAPWAVLGFTAVVVGGGPLLLGRGIGLAVALTAVGYAAGDVCDRPASSRARARRRTGW